MITQAIKSGESELILVISMFCGQMDGESFLGSIHPVSQVLQLLSYAYPVFPYPVISMLVYSFVS